MAKWRETIILLIVSTVSGLMTGCGGDSSANTASINVKIAINEKNADQVISDVFDATGNVTPQLPGLLNAKTASLTLKQLISKPEQKNSSAIAPGNCINGGSVTFDGMRVIYSECKDGNITLDGEVTVEYNGNTRESVYTLRDFSIDHAETQYVTSLTIYRISSKRMHFETTGHVVKGEHEVAFKKFKYTLESRNNRTFVSMSGALKTDCLGNWVDIETVHPMSVGNEVCPTSGEIAIKGENSEFKVLFNQDNSVDTYLNAKQYRQYKHCNKLPGNSGDCRLKSI